MTTDSRFYDVYRTRRTRRAIPIRTFPTDWDTAVSDYRRHADQGHQVLMYESNESGTDKIREITAEEIAANKPKDVQA